jgi:hypothetical protein
MARAKNDVTLIEMRDAATHVTSIARNRAFNAGHNVVYVANGVLISESKDGKKATLMMIAGQWVRPSKRRWTIAAI